MENDYTNTEKELFIDFIGKLSDDYRGIPKITREPLCFYCEKIQCIRSHSISENVLNEISSPNKDLFKFNDKWFYFKVAVSRLKKIKHFNEMHDSEPILNDSTSSDSSGFDGFCNSCDSVLFDSLDNGIKNGKSRFMWELLYRTIGYKVRYMEEELNMAKQILIFAENNSFFCDLWKESFKNTKIEILYGTKESIKNKISTLIEILNYLHSEMLNIKKYEKDMLSFRKDFFWKEIQISKDSLLFLGVNYISFLYEGENLLDHKLDSDLLVAQFGYKSLSWTKENPKYHYSQIIICKKKSENILEEMINEFGYKELVNNILVHNEKMHANTFFKRFSNKNDRIQSKQEKEKLGDLLREVHYSKI